MKAAVVGDVRVPIETAAAGIMAPHSLPYHVPTIPRGGGLGTITIDVYGKVGEEAALKVPIVGVPGETRGRRGDGEI